MTDKRALAPALWRNSCNIGKNASRKLSKCSRCDAPSSEDCPAPRQVRDRGVTARSDNITTARISLPRDDWRSAGGHKGRHASTVPDASGDSQTWKQHSGVEHLSWSKRVRHVTWAYFTVTMATGGLANVLYHLPFQFHGLYTIGLVIALANIVLYLAIWAMMITRFLLYPSVFRDSLTHPTESLFVPAFAVSFGTILINIVEYGADRAGPWLLRAALVLFWLDCATSVVLSITIYMILWSSTSFTIAQMTPIWIFPAYPVLIIGPHAANLAAKLDSVQEAIQVIIGGFTIQGIGFLFGLTIYSSFVYRLMTQKLPAERLRPGMFVSVGPAAFTASGTINLARNLDHTIALRETFMGVPGELAAQILKLVANWMCLWLWGLAFWFFFVSLVSNVQCFQKQHRMPFAMTWFSFIFPQTALCTATFAIANAFEVEAIKVIGCGMAILLVMVWMFVVWMMIRAIIRKDILWPRKGEDKEEGGFQKKSGPDDLEAGLPKDEGIKDVRKNGTEVCGCSTRPSVGNQAKSAS